jgi:hypothetical protein
MVMMFTKMRMNHFEGSYFNFFQMTYKKYKMQFIGRYIVYNYSNINKVFRIGLREYIQLKYSFNILLFHDI